MRATWSEREVRASWRRMGWTVCMPRSSPTRYAEERRMVSEPAWWARRVRVRSTTWRASSGLMGAWFMLGMVAERMCCVQGWGDGGSLSFPGSGNLVAGLGRLGGGDSRVRGNDGKGGGEGGGAWVGGVHGEIPAAGRGYDGSGGAVWRSFLRVWRRGSAGVAGLGRLCGGDSRVRGNDGKGGRGRWRVGLEVFTARYPRRGAGMTENAGRGYDGSFFVGVTRGWRWGRGIPARGRE